LALACAISLAACSKKNPQPRPALVPERPRWQRHRVRTRSRQRGTWLCRRIPDRRWRPCVLPDGPGDTHRRGQGYFAQAGVSWLNPICRCADPDRRPCRRTRHPRVQSVAFCPQSHGSAQFPDFSEGISSIRISSIAYGKERPAALCDAEECWSQNRRAVTVITGGARTS
jgi:hypothetical protein